MQDSAREVGTSSQVTFFNGSLPMNVPELADQRELIYNQGCADTGCSLEDHQGAVDDMNG